MQQKLHEEGLKGQIEHEEKMMGNFRLIYPSDDCDKYQKFYNTVPLVYEDTKASKSRAENARLLREKLDNKQMVYKPRGESPKRIRLVKNQTPVQSMPIDTTQPCDIVYLEEKRRCDEMERRDAQMRMYGIVGAVKKLFSMINQPSIHTIQPVSLPFFNSNDQEGNKDISNIDKHALNVFNLDENDDDGDDEEDDDEDDYGFNYETDDGLEEGVHDGLFRVPLNKHLF